LGKTLVGEGSLDTDDGGLVRVGDNLLKAGDDLRVSKDGNSLKKDNLLLSGSGRHPLPNLFLHKLQDFIVGKVGSTEGSRNLNREFGLSNSGVDASLVGEGSERKETNLSVNGLLLEKPLDGIPEHADEVLGWESDVLGNGQKIVNLLNGIHTAVADQFVAHGKRWSSSSDKKGIVEEGVEATGVVALSFNDKGFVDLPELLPWEGADETDDKAILHHDLVDIKGVGLGPGLTESLDNIVESSLHTLLTLL
jgi:hypothetical protein